MSRLKRNLGYQTVYQILSVCLPLITTPYLSRVLGASNLGQFSYIGSVTNYFTLFAMLGVTNYGTRTIAESSGDRGAVSRMIGAHPLANVGFRALNTREPGRALLRGLSMAKLCRLIRPYPETPLDAFGAK